MSTAAPPNAPAPPLADATPIGLIGLAVGCAALTPIALGVSLTPAALSTAAIFCYLFGGAGQFVAGLVALINRNIQGGTLLTAFSFNWFVNGWALESVAAGVFPDHGVLLAVDLTFLLIFLVLTWSFAHFSGLLALLLLDIDLLYVFKAVAGLTGTQSLAVPIAAATIILGLLALWLAFAILVNPVAGRPVFGVPGPLIKPRAAR